MVLEGRSVNKHRIYPLLSAMRLGRVHGLWDLAKAKSEQDKQVWWFSSAFSTCPCWSHAHFRRLCVNVSISRKVGQLVCHSKKIFGKFRPHRIRKKRNTFVPANLPLTVSPGL